jgi:hypothetical protein
VKLNICVKKSAEKEIVKLYFIDKEEFKIYYNKRKTKRVRIRRN